MSVGAKLLKLAAARGARTIFVVGTAKGVGKTTALRTMYEAAAGEGVRTALVSVGFRSRLALRPNTLFATARALLPDSPGCEILELSRVASAAGPLLYARTVYDGAYDVVGPSSASGLREVTQALAPFSDLLFVDGAIDRLAMLAASDAAVVVSCGAAGAKTAAEAVAGMAALVTRLRVPAYDAREPWVEIEAALTATLATEFIAADEARQIVVRDPTQIVMSGPPLVRALERLRVRCRRPLAVVATTVCALAPERSFEPGAFLRDVAGATGLPAFDVFAGAAA